MGRDANRPTLDRMCLAVPGQILSVTDDGELTRSGRVQFGGVIREVNLALVPEAKAGDYVVVHVGLALARVDEAEARQTLAVLEQMGEEIGQNPGSTSTAASDPDPSGP